MLTIQPLTPETREQFNLADARFLAGDRVQLRVTRKGFIAEYIPMPAAEWRTVKPRITDTARLLADPSAMACLAVADGRCVGQAVARLSNHRLCELLDLRVDAHHRRHGVGSALLSACVDWTKRSGRAGLRVETTDEQPLACLFLEHAGFALGGVDRLLHWAEPEQQQRMPAIRESVLVFYRFF